MKNRTFISVNILAVLASFTIFNTAFADTAATVSATCKDGTTFTGTSKKGACKGHHGVKSWDSAATTTAVVPATTSTPTPAAASPVAGSTKPAMISGKSAMPTVAAPGGGAGKVWVNSSTKVYHCPGTKYYGKTKEGSYMSEADAKAQGDHPDHGKTCS